jgi:hypothetical protein
MSHNKTKIGTAEQDREGNMLVTLSDLNDVSGIPSEGQILKYSSGSWEAANMSSVSSSVSFIMIGRGEDSSYTNSPQSTNQINVNDVIYLYDTNPRNTISGATITQTNNWVESVTLPIGQYLIRAQSEFQFSASGHAAYCMFNNTTKISQAGVIGEQRGAYAGGGALSIGYINLTSQTTVTLKFESISNIDTPSNQGNFPSNHGMMFIEKVS